MLVRSLHSIKFGVLFFKYSIFNPPGFTKELTHSPFLLNPERDIFI